MVQHCSNTGQGTVIRSQCNKGQYPSIFFSVQLLWQQLCLKVQKLCISQILLWIFVDEMSHTVSLGWSGTIMFCGDGTFP